MASRLVLASMLIALVGGAGVLRVRAADDPLARGLGAVESMAGCYLVDYSYVEVESLKPGHAPDARGYDVNPDKSAKEWITPEVLAPHPNPLPRDPRHAPRRLRHARPDHPHRRVRPELAGTAGQRQDHPPRRRAVAAGP